MRNIFTTIRKAMFPTRKERDDAQVAAGFKFGRDHFMPATNFDELDRLYDALPSEAGHPFDLGVKAAYREKNTKLGDIDHMAHKIRPPVAPAKPAWAQGADLLNLKVGDQCIINVKKRDGEVVSFMDLRDPVIQQMNYADSWRTLMGIRRVGDDERGKPKYRGKASNCRIKPRI